MMIRTGWGSTLALAIAAGFVLAGNPAEAQRRSERNANQVPGMVMLDDPAGSTSRRSSRRNAQPAAPQQPQQNPAAAQAAQAAAKANPKAPAKPAVRTASSAKSTTSTASKARPAGGASGAKPGGAGYGAQGQVREITREMAESLRPLRVDYDPVEMEQNPGVIILNPRRYQSGGEKSGNSTVRRQTESSADFVRPL